MHRALLKPAGRLASFELLEELEAQNTVRRFGHHSWGHSLFDEHKELAFGWQRGLLGVRSPRTEAYRRRRCGVKASGQAVPFDANSVHVSDMLLCYPEEGAVCSVSLVAEPATSPTGQIMTIARDGDGTLERVFLDNQLPCVGPVAAELAQARFAKGTKLTIMEPLLLVTRDGLRGIAVRAGEVRVSSLGLDPAQARALGNKAVASQQYAAAAEFYCLGLQHSEMDMLVTLLSNRCQVWLCQAHRWPGYDEEQAKAWVGRRWQQLSARGRAHLRLQPEAFLESNEVDHLRTPDKNSSPGIVALLLLAALALLAFLAFKALQHCQLRQEQLNAKDASSLIEDAQSSQPPAALQSTSKWVEGPGKEDAGQELAAAEAGKAAAIASGKTEELVEVDSAAKAAKLAEDVRGEEQAQSAKEPSSLMEDVTDAQSSQPPAALQSTSKWVEVPGKEDAGRELAAAEAGKDKASVAVRSEELVEVDSADKEQAQRAKEPSALMEDATDAQSSQPPAALQSTSEWVEAPETEDAGRELAAAAAGKTEASAAGSAEELVEVDAAKDSNRPSLGGWRARGQRLAAMAKTESDSDAPKGSLATPEARKMRLKEIAKKMEEDTHGTEFDIDLEDGILGFKFTPGELRVEQVMEDSACAKQGLCAGDQLIQVDLEPVENLSLDLSEKLQTRPLRMRFRRPVARREWDLGTAGAVMSGLSRWTKSAKTAAEAMRQKEKELEELQAKAEADWEDGVPEDEKRVFPRPNIHRYKWVLRTCFEHDWAFIRQKLLREDNVFREEEVDEVGECLRTKYMWVMPLYRKTSSEETSEGGSCPENISQFGVSRRSIMKLLGPEGISIVDKSTLTQAKVGEVYKKANYALAEETAGFAVRCDNLLSRHQFAELLVWIAITKWPNEPKVKSVEDIFQELSTVCSKYSGDMRLLLASGSDDAVQETFEQIESQTWAVFTTMSSIHEISYGHKMMTLQDWRTLLNRMNIFAIFPAIKRKYAAYTFRMGLEPQADEQYNKTWQLMSFLEFQRALGAVMFLSELRVKQAFLKTRDFGAAACEAAAVLQARPGEPKAVARYAQALRGLGTERLAARAEGSPYEVDLAEWQTVTAAAAKAAAKFALAGSPPVAMGSNLAAKRAVDSAKEAANEEYKKGNYVAAIEGYTRALGFDPVLEDASAILSNLAHCRLWLGQPHCAVAAAATCLRLRPRTLGLKALRRLTAGLACLGRPVYLESS
ncbi:unnamed protein product [Effrenium voratum]|uniref:PDZ domain-containing protein n=1 Tax=Effrenium voratum TaxID=2562239 RepID=A0AA36IKM7_9DINO|nr:unnamed protein product [Effrenium voratum]